MKTNLSSQIKLVRIPKRYYAPSSEIEQASLSRNEKIYTRIFETSDEGAEDVAFLVGVVTKQKKEKYDKSKQVDNYRQILASVQYDVRAILVKLADRLQHRLLCDFFKPQPCHNINQFRVFLCQFINSFIQIKFLCHDRDTSLSVDMSLPVWTFSAPLATRNERSVSSRICGADGMLNKYIYLTITE